MNAAPARTGNSYLDPAARVPVRDVMRTGLVRCTRQTTAAEIARVVRSGAQAVIEDRVAVAEPAPAARQDAA